MSDIIPRPDAEFDVWQKENLQYVETNAKKWGIPDAEITKLKERQSNWEPAFEKADNIENRTRANVLAKNEIREDYEKNWRYFINTFIRVNPKITDDERLIMGIHPKKHSRTPIPVPETAPEGRIDFSVRLQHKIFFHDSSTPNSKAKPKGVHGCQIWMKLGEEAPVKENDLTFVAMDTSSPYTVKFDGDDSGKKAYYWLRWVNSKGEPGPWSAEIHAVVVG